MASSLSHYIRDIQNFPKPGILFRDISPLLESAKIFSQAIDELSEAVNPADFDLIAGIESRGFIFGSALAVKLNKGFVPVRKKGKLPPPVEKYTYDLEYGQDTLEIKKGQGRVLVIDDVLATGGTLNAAIKLCGMAGYQVADIAVLINLKYLNQFRWNNKEVQSVIDYDA